MKIPLRAGCCGEAEGTPGPRPALGPLMAPMAHAACRTLLAAGAPNSLGIELHPWTSRDLGASSAFFPLRVVGKTEREFSCEGKSMSAWPCQVRCDCSYPSPVTVFENMELSVQISIFILTP